MYYACNTAPGTVTAPLPRDATNNQYIFFQISILGLAWVARETTPQCANVLVKGSVTYVTG
jgi:hypothetical protein